jgi:hypothetical protein
MNSDFVTIYSSTSFPGSLLLGTRLYIHIAVLKCINEDGYDDSISIVSRHIFEEINLKV